MGKERLKSSGTPRTQVAAQKRGRRNEPADASMGHRDVQVVWRVHITLQRVRCEERKRLTRMKAALRVLNQRQ
jgi:hypothetical protein